LRTAAQGSEMLHLIRPPAAHLLGRQMTLAQAAVARDVQALHW